MSNSKLSYDSRVSFYPAQPPLILACYIQTRPRRVATSTHNGLQARIELGCKTCLQISKLLLRRVMSLIYFQGHTNTQLRYPTFSHKDNFKLQKHYSQRSAVRPRDFLGGKVTHELQVIQLHQETFAGLLLWTQYHEIFLNT